MAAANLLIDTDILIDYLRAHPLAVSFLDHLTETVFISVVTVSELYAGIKNSSEIPLLQQFISSFKVIPIDEEIAQDAGLIKNTFNKSHGMGLADALIAATVKKEKASLCTLNVKHFPMFDSLKPPYKK